MWKCKQNKAMIKNLGWKCVDCVYVQQFWICKDNIGNIDVWNVKIHISIKKLNNFQACVSFSYIYGYGHGTCSWREYTALSLLHVRVFVFHEVRTGNQRREREGTKYRSVSLWWAQHNDLYGTELYYIVCKVGVKRIKTCCRSEDLSSVQ